MKPAEKLFKAKMQLARDVRRSELKIGPRFLFGALIDHLNCETGLCFPSIEALALDIGASEHTAKRYLKPLIEAGHVVQTRRRRQSALYTFPALNQEVPAVGISNDDQEVPAVGISKDQEVPIRELRSANSSIQEVPTAALHIDNREGNREENREVSVESARARATPLPKKAARSRKAPPDWQRSERDLVFARQDCRMADEMIAREIAKFRRCEFKTAKSDWSDTFQSWCITAVEINARHQRPSESRVDAALRTIEEQRR